MPGCPKCGMQYLASHACPPLTYTHGANTAAGVRPGPLERAYAEGYKAGRVAALREVGCEYCGGTDTHKVRGGVMCDCMVFPRQGCRRCRLLAEAESGEDTVEVGDDR